MHKKAYPERALENFALVHAQNALDTGTPAAAGTARKGEHAKKLQRTAERSDDTKGRDKRELRNNDRKREVAEQGRPEAL